MRDIRSTQPQTPSSVSWRTRQNDTVSRAVRDRTHFVSDNQRLIHFFTSPGFRSHALGLMRIPGQADSPRVSARDWLASVVRVLRDHRVRRVGALKAKVLARHLADLHEPTVSDRL